MKRSGFTMIELVFVIVILGILASVAIPKLAATRDDANIAKASTELSSLISDMGSYYTAQGHFGKVSEMTNVALMQGADGAQTSADTIDMNASTSQVFYWDKQRKKNCISIKAIDSTGELNVTTVNANSATPFCKGLNTAVGTLITTHTFGGSSIYK